MSSCAGCGSLFPCAMVDGDDDQACWCAQLPAVVIPPMPDARCFCPQCLAALLRENPPSPVPDCR